MVLVTRESTVQRSEGMSKLVSPAWHMSHVDIYSYRPYYAYPCVHGIGTVYRGCVVLVAMASAYMKHV